MDESQTAAAAPAPEAPPAAPSGSLRPAAPGLSAAPAATGGAPQAEPSDALVERWWNDYFPGSPVAQVTAAWNVAFAAKEELKRRLMEGV
jgi:hypothetical protein